MTKSDARPRGDPTGPHADSKGPPVGGALEPAEHSQSAQPECSPPEPLWEGPWEQEPAEDNAAGPELDEALSNVQQLFPGATSIGEHYTETLPTDQAASASGHWREEVGLPETDGANALEPAWVAEYHAAARELDDDDAWLALNEALEWASWGRPVFPCHTIRGDGRCTCGKPCGRDAGKHPRTKHGKDDATDDLAQIIVWWRRWPGANIGVRTGDGFFVVDVDSPEGEAWLDGQEMPETLTARTGLDGDFRGRHLYLYAPEGVKIPTRTKIVPGVDIKGDGGYVIAPPSSHLSGVRYAWWVNRPIAEAPAWLLEVVREQPRPERPAAPLRVAGEASAYGRAALERELEELQAAGEGTRNDTLFRKSAKLAELVAGGELPESVVREDLEAVGVAIGLEPSKVRATIDSGFNHGTTQPRAAPERAGSGPGRCGKCGRELWSGLCDPCDVPPEEVLEVLDDEVPEALEPAEHPWIGTPMDPPGPSPRREPSSWEPIDLTEALAGKDLEPPTRLKRDDGLCLLYERRVHWLSGETESCKSWVAQLAVADALQADEDVLYVDFEDDERGVCQRLRSLGVRPELVAGHLVYLRPDEPLAGRGGKPAAGGAALDELVGQRAFALAVVDGVTEGMTVEGLDLLSNADVAAWMRRLPRRLAAKGATVVCIDHIPKSHETNAKFAIGAQHKIAGVTGAAYKLTTRTPFGRAGADPRMGRVEIAVTKDRVGYVRGQCPDDGKVGTAVLTSFPDGGVEIVLSAPGSEKDRYDRAMVTRVLDYLALYEGASSRKLEEGVEGNSAAKRQAVRSAIDLGYVRVEKSGKTHEHYLTDEGRKALKALSEQ